MRKMILVDPLQLQNEKPATILDGNGVAARGAGWSSYESRLDKEIAKILQEKTVKQGGRVTEEEKLHKYLDALQRFIRARQAQQHKVSDQDQNIQRYPNDYVDKAVETVPDSQQQQQQLPTDEEIEADYPLDDSDLNRTIVERYSREQPKWTSFEEDDADTGIESRMTSSPSAIAGPSGTSSSFHTPLSSTVISWSPEVQKNNDTIIDDLLKQLPSDGSKRIKAKYILDTMLRRKYLKWPVTFDPSNKELIVKNKRIPNSNVREILRTFLNKKAQHRDTDQPGWNEFQAQGKQLELILSSWEKYRDRERESKEKGEHAIPQLLNY